MIDCFIYYYFTEKKKDLITNIKNHKYQNTFTLIDGDFYTGEFKNGQQGQTG